jgi:hypothetical protein
MNEEVLSKQEDRGRVIAHVFYSELEKISRARLSQSQLRAAISEGRNLLTGDIAKARGSAPKTKWWQLSQKMKDRKLTEGKIREMKAGMKAEEKRLTATYRSDRAAALKDMAYGDAAAQRSARKFLEAPAKSGPGVPRKGGEVPKVDSPKPKGKGKASFTENVGKATIGTALVGGAGYGGYKYLKRRSNTTPYSAYGGAY